MRRSAFFIGMVLLAGCFGVWAQGGPKTSVEGIWQGLLKAGSLELRVVFKIKAAEDGALEATLDSPDQGATNIPVDEVRVENGRLSLKIEQLRLSYEGQINEAGTEIQGQLTQAGMTFPLDLKRVEKAPEIRRPQEPKKPYPYDEEEVVYTNPQDGVKLAATLTLPRTEGPHPAVVLISGSGAQDRNETVFAHRPFLVLADYLTRRGIAVLRADDRGVGGSTGNISEATSENFALDALAGVAYLKGRKEIDPRHIGLIGHSEGGIIAPIAAVKSRDVAFIVMMAGTGLTGEEILYRQAALIARAEGAPEEKIEENRRIQERIFAVLKQAKDLETAKKKLRALVPKTLDMMSEQEKKAIPDPEKLIQTQMERLLSPWFRHFLTYDPRPTLRKVRCPVLAINGSLDLQVPARENLSAIEKALKEGGNTDVTIKEFPGLNHLFQTAKTGSPSEYGKIEETISPGVLKYIADWILARCGRAEE